VLAPQTPQPILAVVPTRGSAQGQDHRGGHQEARGGPQGGKSGDRLDVQFIGPPIYNSNEVGS